MTLRPVKTPQDRANVTEHSPKRGLTCSSPLDITATIPSSISYRPASIQLRNIPTSLHRLDDQSASPVNEKPDTRSSFASARSDSSLWSDTGDLAEQLADEDDPLNIRLRDSLDEELFGGSAGRARGPAPKRVRYLQQDHLERKITHPGVDKEAIQIPSPLPRRISRTEKALATIMTGNRAASQMHGLTGKPLLYVPQYRQMLETLSLTGYSYFTSVFVSLGVFLFGYDQGVMSGIITYVDHLVVYGEVLNNGHAEVLILRITSTSQHEPRLVPWWLSLRSAHSCLLSVLGG